MQTHIRRECEKALDKINLLYLLSQYGRFQEIHGYLVGPCPFNDDHRAKMSLAINATSLTFHCVYGKCAKRGSLIELIAAFEQLDEDAACAKIIQLSRVDAGSDQYANKAEPKLLKDASPFGPETGQDANVAEPNLAPEPTTSKSEFLQDSFVFLNEATKQIRFPKYTQKSLRLLKQCQLRFWHQYVMHTDLDQQAVQSTIGSLIHATLKEFYRAPLVSRTKGNLFSLFTKRWGRGYGAQEDREFWFEKAHMALENVYQMNLNINPIKTDVEITKSVSFPFGDPSWQLQSTADRVDWYSNTEYRLIDYKWDEKPITEEDAAADFQTVIYYLTWIGDGNGVPPALISYQFLTPGMQVDVTPTVTTMEVGIERLIQYIEKAEYLKSKKEEPAATRNEYCYNCKLYGKCPATKP